MGDTFRRGEGRGGGGPNPLISLVCITTHSTHRNTFKASRSKEINKNIYIHLAIDFYRQVH